MSYTCYHCAAEIDDARAHGITVYDKNGVEERTELLCDECYREWLESLKG
ncbi:MAG: hypothetical protein C0P68_007915 [Bacillota bacterium]